MNLQKPHITIKLLGIKLSAYKPYTKNHIPKVQFFKTYVLFFVDLIAYTYDCPYIALTPLVKHNKLALLPNTTVDYF